MNTKRPRGRQRLRTESNQLSRDRAQRLWCVALAGFALQTIVLPALAELLGSTAYGARVSFAGATGHFCRPDS